MSKAEKTTPWANGIKRDGPEIINRIKAGLYVFFLLYTATVGYLVLLSWAPLLLIFAPRLYRKWTDAVARWWFIGSVFCVLYLFGTQFVVSGDCLDPADHAAIFLANHRTQLDWLFLWNFFFARTNRLYHEKIILKGPLKYMPFF